MIFGNPYPPFRGGAAMPGKRGQPLTAAFVRNVRHKGGKAADKYSDGSGLGLLLQVMPGGSKQWVQRLALAGVRRDYGLGGYPLVGLKEARVQAVRNAADARAYRLAVHRGDQPPPLPPGFERARLATLRKRKGLRVGEAAAVRHGPSFADMWEGCIVEAGAGWKNPETNLRNWRYDLRESLKAISDYPVAAVSVDHLREVLSPLGPAKRDKLLRRLGTVFDWAIGSGHRADNPARTLRATPGWRGGRNGNGDATRHPSMPWREVPSFWTRLRGHATEGAAAALALVVLTGVRSKEAYLAEWPEVAWEGAEGATWTVPATRMKDGRAHRVPLSGAAREVLRRAVGARKEGLVFHGPRGRALSDKDLRKVVAALGLAGTASVHGFRSTLRDWCGEQGVARELAEQILAHRVGNQVEQAYARSDLFARRARVMEDWGRFVAGAG